MFDPLYDLMMPIEEPKKVLILGVSNNIMGIKISEIYPTVEYVLVDIDPTIDGVIHMDGGEYVASTTEKFDLVIADAWDGDKYPSKFMKDPAFVENCSKVTKHLILNLYRFPVEKVWSESEHWQMLSHVKLKGNGVYTLRSLHT